MKKVIFIFCLVLGVNLAYAQSDDCLTATVITPGATCVNTSGTTTGATQSFTGCVGTANDDVWYQFTASATSHQVTVTPSLGFDPVVQLFSGSCSSLTTISCMDNSLTGDPEIIYASGLTIGQVYKIRVYDYYSGVPATSTFSICVLNPVSAPSNNDCAGATTLNVNTSCSAIAGTTVGATQSSIGCAGIADDDVWYKFVATNAVQTITVDPSATMDVVVQLYGGPCGTLTSISCTDQGFTDANEVINAVGLVAGTTYYVRVYDYYNATGGAPFTICVSGAATAVPSNDEPCNAIQLPTITSACNYLNFTTAGATTTTAPGAPSTCGGSGAQQGGFGTGTKDVWFAITVPATGSLAVTIKPGLVSPMNDMVFALYSGACGSLTQISCADDYNYPGTANDFQPFLNQTGLTPGATVYLRVFRYGTTNSGNFGLCVTTNTNDDCANALYMCDLNGYSASTSAAFTPDRPGTGAGQMYGNNETTTGVNQPDGVNTFGPFGYYPPSNIPGPYSSPAIDVGIEKNSWIRFTAAAAVAVLNVTIGDCFVGGYPSGGLQMQIFSSSGCNNFVPVSQFREGSNSFVVTGQGLTPGQDYYLMIDGFAGDICNYTISTNSGVAPDIIVSASPICNGASTTLTGPPGAALYEWLPGGETTQVITVSPSTTTTYTLFVTGFGNCGQRQTLTKTIVVNSNPTMTSTSSPAAICSGTNVGLTLTSDISSSYTWLAADSSNIIGESIAMESGNVINNALSSISSVNEMVTYTVTPTSISGACQGAPQTVTVTVKPSPVLAVIPNQAVCSGSNVATINYISSPLVSMVNWTNSNGSIGLAVSGTGDIASFTSPFVSSTEVANITATPLLNGCIGMPQTFSITVNPLPTIGVSPTITQSSCSAATGSITDVVAVGASPLSYSWNGGVFSTVSDLTNVSAGNYSLIVNDGNGCSDTSSYTVTTFSIPNAPLADTLVTYCQNDPSSPLTATAQSGGTLNWYADAGATTLISTPTPNTSIPGITSYYVSETVNGCESILSSTSVNINAFKSISGTALANLVPLTNGLVYLFAPSLTTFVFDTIAITNINNTGQYIFTNVVPGSYLLKCLPDSISNPELMNTYYGDTTSWENANGIVHNCDSDFVADIHVLEASSGVGPGYISGTVIEGAGYGNRLLQSSNAVLTVGDAIKNVDVNLVAIPSGNTVAQSTTDSSGFFEFTNVEVGDYILQVDIPGLIMDSTYTISITPFAFIGNGGNQVMSSVFSGLDFIADDNSIYPSNSIGINKGSSNVETGIILYPNPVSDNLNVVLKNLSGEETVFKIINSLGELVYEKATTNNHTILNIEHLNSGVYFLSIVSENGVANYSFVKQN